MSKWRHLIGWAWLFRRYRFTVGTTHLEPRFDPHGNVYMLIAQPGWQLPTNEQP